MENKNTANLFITHVEKEGPFLKLWGQTDKNTSLAVETVLTNVTSQFEAGMSIIPLENIHSGQLVCAKYKDDKYYRARIVNVSNNGLVEVSFIDYGNRDYVQFINLRHMQNFPPNFISIPPLVQPYIFAEVHSPGGGEWNNDLFEKLSKELKYREVQCTCIAQAAQYPLVKLFYGGSDLAVVLNCLLQHIPLQAQQAVLLSMSINMNPVMQPQPLLASSTPAEINTYKAIPLEPGRSYPVFVSYVNDGPCHFSIQLESSLDCLGKLMTEVNSANLKPLDDVPIPGTICLAKCEDDGNICRAVITNEVDNQFKVFYVDFGNYELVHLAALYQIPFKYVIPKVMAIRFALAGVEKSTVTIEMQCAFKQFVDDRLLHMKVLPSATRLAIPKCELWDPITETSALDVVNRAARNAYPEPMVLNRGFCQSVKVSFVYSCNRFYVQLANKEDELMKLMMDLQQSCLANDIMDTSSLTVGLPCCALYEADMKWYRSQIVEIIPGGNVKVRYIDYGNEEVVSSGQLKLVEGEQLTVLRPQAIECCLNGYQNMVSDQDRDNLLEELILENKFTMKVVEMVEKKALVELIDESNYNVASLLLDKIASQNSQVSPMLVQANHRIEHPKSQAPQYNRDFRQERKPGREHKNYNERNEKSWRNDDQDSGRDHKNYNERNEKSWRNDDQNSGRNDRNSNENFGDQRSWRQQNKGFNNQNNDEYRNTDNRNSNERFNNKGYNRNKDWNNKSNNSTGNDDWNTTAEPNSNVSPSSDTGYNTRYNSNDSKPRSNGPRDKDRGDWNSNNFKGSGIKKKEFRREGSEISSSGSERSFHKGPRTSTRNERFDKKFDNSRNNKTKNRDESWSVSSIDAASSSRKYEDLNIVGTESKIIISWFHSPNHFYCQLTNNQDVFKKLMEDLQNTYKGCKPGYAQVGAPVVGLFPEDKVLYRAKVLEVLGSKYKVYYVDFGNVSVIDHVWPIDNKFMDVPAQALCCEMNDLAPINDSWGDPDVYAKYYDKDEFDCYFVSTNNGKTQVTLQHAGIDLGQQLVADGLANFKSASLTSIEIPLLLGQQFRAQLISVNNLGDIIIALPSNIALNCKVHNLETAIETFEDTLKFYLGKALLVYVDNIFDNVLEVTFYDVEGNKLVIVNPDEGAFDNVEALCPFLVMYSSIVGTVSHTSSTEVYIQPKELADTICYYLEQLYEHYFTTTQESPIIPEEGFVYAVLSADENWYRGKVISFDDEKAVVQFVDYGNTESVEFSALREITPDFLIYPELCLKVSVNIPTDDLVEKSVIASVYYGDSCWEGQIQIQDGATLPIQENVEVSSSVPVEQFDAVETNAKNVVEEITEIHNRSQTVAPNSIGTSVIVSHIDSPTEFYIQLADALQSIDDLQTDLQETVLNLPTLENPSAGVYCAAPYSVDQLFYRAQVLDADADITTVRFIDFGNTDVIDNQTTQIKTLPQNLLTLEVYATRCSLQIKPTEEEWSSVAHDRFVELTTKDVTVEFIDQDEKTNYVDLYSGGNKVTDVLINEKLALPNKFVVESKSTCFVSHVNSPSEFWIQLENCADELEWIAEQLSDAENFPELDDLTPGTLCVALFPDDGMWYRARILSNTIAGIELLFLDYGNSCIGCNLRQIPEELVVTNPLAQKCSLQKPNKLNDWSPEIIEKFSETAADGQTIFTVQKITTGETSTVQLFLDGVDVIDFLIPQTEDCIIRNAKSSEEFEIEKVNGELLSGKYKLKRSNELSWSEESESYFQSVCIQENPLQVQFLPDNFVRLYISGKEICLNLKVEPDNSVIKVNAAEILTDHLTIVENLADNNTKSEDDLTSFATPSDQCIKQPENDITDNISLAEVKLADSTTKSEDDLSSPAALTDQCIKQSENDTTDDVSVAENKLADSTAKSEGDLTSPTTSTDQCMNQTENDSTDHLSVAANQLTDNNAKSKGDLPSKLPENELTTIHSPIKNEIKVSETINSSREQLHSPNDNKEISPKLNLPSTENTSENNCDNKNLNITDTLNISDKQEISGVEELNSSAESITSHMEKLVNTVVDNVSTEDPKE